jgi:hypothetical protein
MKINANATSIATQVLNKGAGLVAKQNIEYTTLALADVQSKIGFTTPKSSLLDYFNYQRVSAIPDNSTSQLLLGVNATMISA